MRLRRIHRCREQAEIGDRREGAVQAVLVGIVGVRAGPLGHDDVSDLHPVGDRTAGADADQVLHAVYMDQLMAVDADGRDPHARPHDRNGFSLVGPCESEHIADGIELHRVFKKCVCDHFRPQGIPRQKDRLCNLSDLRCIVWCRHIYSFLFRVLPGPCLNALQVVSLPERFASIIASNLQI